MANTKPSAIGINSSNTPSHLMVPVVCSATGSTIIPSFEYLVMSKTAKVMAQEMKREESARTRPVVKTTSE
jgi:hypothetical protein